MEGKTDRQKVDWWREKIVSRFRGLFRVNKNVYFPPSYLFYTSLQVVTLHHPHTSPVSIATQILQSSSTPPSLPRNNPLTSIIYGRESENYSNKMFVINCLVINSDLGIIIIFMLYYNKNNRNGTKKNLKRISKRSIDKLSLKASKHFY